MPPRGPLERRKGFSDGDGVRDTSLYFEEHGVVVDVIGRDAGVSAYKVRGLDAVNVPTELFRVDKDGAATLLGDLTANGTAFGAGLAAETAARIAGDAANAADITALKSATANLLTNPGFEVWQRGTSFVAMATGAYGPDRWQFVKGGSSALTLTQDPAAGVESVGSRYAAKLVYTHNAASWLRQTAEDYLQYAGRTAAFAVRVLCTTPGAVRLEVGDGTTTTASAANTGAAGWETLTVTAPIGAAPTLLTASVALLASCTAWVDNATLVQGAVAMTYAPLHPAEDLARCLRYYFVVGGLVGYEYAATGMCHSTTAFAVMLRYPVEMVATPTMTISAAADWAVYSATGTVIACATLTFTVNNRRSAGLSGTVASGLVAGNATELFSNNTTNARLIFEANP